MQRRQHTLEMSEREVAMAHVLSEPTTMLTISGAAVRLSPKMTKPAILEIMPGTGKR